VPATDVRLLDTCLLILHDWSYYLTLDGDEIDAERGVISEEWRTRRTPQFRLLAQTLPVLFKDSKYAERDVIGDLDIIKNFKHQTIRDFYREWYRTDLEAIAVVGDFDVARMEQGNFFFHPDGRESETASFFRNSRTRGDLLLPGYRQGSATVFRQHHHDIAGDESRGEADASIFEKQFACHVVQQHDRGSHR
jgi:hypothetical protein